jgi:PAS domain S-box-containing protein
MSGEQALQKLQEQSFAVVLLDVRMQPMNGLETAQRIRNDKNLRHTPIIFISAAENGEEESAYKLGAVDYLRSPIVPQVLVAKVATLADLFEQKEEARREADQLRMLVQGATDYAIFMLDATGHVATWNTGAKRLKGYRADEIVGKHFSTFYPEKAKATGWPEHELKVAAAEGRFEDEGWRVRKDGSTFWANVVISALKDESGALRGFTKVTRDLTERRRREEDLRKLSSELEQRVKERTAELSAANEALKERDRQKDDFIAMLAHELRNPLAPITNALRLLQLKKDEATVDAVRQMVGRQVGQLSHLVNDLLDAARIRAGKIKLRSELVDLAQLARIAANDQRSTFEEASVALTVDAPETPVWVWGDWTRLTQVVGNLLQNAVKFTPPGGKVTVTVRPNGQYAKVAVADTGSGIPVELLPRLFTPFAQAEQGLARTEGGLGLGLALVKGLTELHGGEVDVESGGSGKGSTFTLRLPKADEPSAVSGGPALDVEAREKRLRVLIVEDNRDTATSLKQVLEVGGCDVAVAYTGPDGVEKAKTFHPNIVLCDIGLPGFSGFEVARRIRQEANGTVMLVALTGYGRDEDKEEARAAGFNVHFTKPVDFGQLEALLSQAR